MTSQTLAKKARQAKRARLQRGFLIALCLLQIVIACGEFATGVLLGALVSTVIATALALVVTRISTPQVRRLEGQAKPHPDYPLISRLEREIYGEAFHHDGAPDTGGIRIIGDVEVSPGGAGECHQYNCYECGASTFSDSHIARCPACARNALGKVAPPASALTEIRKLTPGARYEYNCYKCQCTWRGDEFLGFCPDCDRKPGVTMAEFNRAMSHFGEAIRNGMSSGDGPAAS